MTCWIWASEFFLTVATPKVRLQTPLIGGSQEVRDGTETGISDALLDQLFKEQIESAAHNQRAEKGREHMMKYHSNEAVSEQYIELYSRLLSEQQSRTAKN